MKIIDCHCHIYPDKIAEKASESTGHFYGLPMCYHGTAAQMLKEREKAGITHSVVFSVATKPSQVRSINAFLADEAAKNPTLAALGASHPDSGDIPGDIQNVLELGFKGIKLHPDIQGVAIDDPRCDEIYRLCEENGLIALIHMGDPRYDLSHPDRLVKILDRYPGLKVVGAHFGGWGIWKYAAERLTKYQNLIVDCSSTMAFMTPDETLSLIRSYGAERVLFGTDYPMWDFELEMQRFNALRLNDDERELILYKNAEKLFFTDLSD